MSAADYWSALAEVKIEAERTARLRLVNPPHRHVWVSRVVPYPIGIALHCFSCACGANYRLRKKVRRR